MLRPTKDFVLPDLVQSYGDQGITGFLNLVGAVKAGGTSDQVDWWEAGRRHRTISVTQTSSKSGDQTTITFAADTTDGVPFGANDVLMDSSDGRRYIVKSMGQATPTDGSLTTAVIASLDGADAIANATSTRDFIVLGNLYGQGTDQPTHFQDADVVKRENPFMIVKDRYEVNGSQATNIGWVNMGNGDYRWFMYGEQEARKRFEDRREMMLLFAEKTIAADVATSESSAYNAAAETGLGSEGYVSAVESRGIVVSNANANPLDSFGEFDDLILQLDKQGAPSEYAMLNRKQGPRCRRHVGFWYRYGRDRRFGWSVRRVQQRR